MASLRHPNLASFVGLCVPPWWAGGLALCMLCCNGAQYCACIGEVARH